MPISSCKFSLLLCVQEVVTLLYVVAYYIKWVTTSWTHSMQNYAVIFNQRVRRGEGTFTAQANRGKQ